MIMHTHALGQLTARATNDGIRLACYLTTPVFTSRRRAADSLTVRILRKTLPGFRFGHHYAEFFDGLLPDDATIVFDGPIDLINRRKLEYVDRTVKPATTYAYWVSSPLGRLPTGPVPVRRRDPRIWWPHREIESRLAALARRYPGSVALKSYGTSTGGHSIPGLILGNRSNCVALVGAIHAGESGPELMIPAVEQLLLTQADLLNKAGIAILPSVNVDERERLVSGCPWYLRTNARGVDINRNFNVNWEQTDAGYGLLSSDPDAATYRGPTPNSEPETRATIRFLKATRPRAVLAYHALAGITGACFLAARSAETDSRYVRACTDLVDPFVHGFYGKTKRWRAGISFGASAGSLPAYAYHKLGIPGFDLEWDGHPDAQPSHTDNTTLAMLRTYQKRHYHGLVSMLKVCAKKDLSLL